MPISPVDKGTTTEAEGSAPPLERCANNCRPLKDTPLPWGQLSIICVVLLTESICWSVLLPFMPSFIAYIKGWDVDSSGYASGFPVGLFMLGQVVSGKLWGMLSNMIGRKVTIVLGVSGCAICMFFFGLSGSLLAMCFWRFMHGLLGGCSIVAKTMISDLTDTTNRAKGLALVSLTWGVGTLIGSAVGGVLYNPASSSALALLHISSTSFVGSHPAFLPSAVVAAYSFFAVVICVMCLQESYRDARPLRDVLPPFIVKFMAPVLRFVQPRLPCDCNATDVTAMCADDHNETSSSAPQKPPPTAARPTPASPTPHTPFGFKQAFLNPLLRRVCIISMLIATSDMMFTEIFPLWVASDVRNGGLHLSPFQISILVLMNAAPSVLANVVFAPVIQYAGGPVRLCIAAQLMYAFFTAMVPTASSLGKRTRFWYTMVFGMLRKAMEAWNYALTMVMVSLTAPQGMVAIMFGIQQSLVCLVRCVVPLIFAPVFAWSIAKPHPFPFNHYLVFLLSVIPLVIGAYIATHVYVLSSYSGDGEEEEEEELEDSSDRVGVGNGGQNSRLNSACGSLCSIYSLFGSVSCDVPARESLLRNSAANSLVTLSSPAMTQHTIFEFPTGSPLLMAVEDAASAARMQPDEAGDSRDNSSQEGDEVDNNTEYASLADEMAVIPVVPRDGVLEQEDIRIAQRSTLLENEELPA
ncbi:transporter-like protein [Leishmania braziliensis MHOM/BR/75/M2904]|uniref:Transporter-like protein n=1 Tax=Leishmania braziliensis TaxID=5660 RepID=A4HMU4_LEIBR|nr:transporter-like protein [Leishmania braziliensis MHOM/BR/75/M2904]CAJ2480391.1 unnamed protein product [Leishmania braziliensis]CAM43485.1 transporter-like protein [Leishmania braziliensis MHOM/BR/75/M2904]